MFLVWYFAIHTMLGMTGKTNVNVVVVCEDDRHKQWNYFVEDGFGVQEISFLT